MNDTGHDNYGDNRQVTREQFDGLRSALARAQDLTEGAIVERDNANRDAAVLRNELRASDMNVGLLHEQVKKEVEAKTEARELANEAIQIIRDVVDGTDHNIERACAFLTLLDSGAK